MPNDSKFQNRPLPKSNKTRQALKKMEDAGAVVLEKTAMAVFGYSNRTGRGRENPTLGHMQPDTRPHRDRN